MPFSFRPHAARTLLVLGAVGAFILQPVFSHLNAARSATPTYSPIILEVLNEVNAFRAQNRLPALRLNARLNTAAQRHSNDMASRTVMSHHCGDGTTMSQRVTQAGYPWRTVAENVAWGQTTPREVVRAWINSPGHRANMLKNTVKDVGIGYNNRFWTLDLAG